MRLRLTVRRHCLPDMRVIWAIDTTSNPTIYHLLEQVNETIPIESDGQWGLENYAVEIKGSTGVNYECLHFQPLANVIKDEDEVIIRPLLGQDIKIRRVSGRVQISAPGRRLVDGVPFGRPLVRKAEDRPAVKIPPRKRARVEYNEYDERPEEAQALEENECEDSEPENNRQLVLHADFEDDDEEDDEDFAPGEDEDADDMEEDDISDEDMEQDNEEEEVENEEEPPIKSGPNGGGADDANEPDLEDVTDPTTRAQIRKLHSAFSKSPLAVCKHVLAGSEDIGQAYEAMARGFIPEKPKSAITEISQGAIGDGMSVPENRSKSKIPSVHEAEFLDSIQVEPEEPALIDHYDQDGFLPGSIQSGKALSVMTEALKSSPTRPHAASRRPASVFSNKSVRFAPDASFSKGLTSTPFVDKDSQIEDEESSEDSNDERSKSEEEDASSSEDSSSSDEETEEVQRSGDSTSSSESDTDSSSDSSSDDDESPEEASSKQESTITASVTTEIPSPSQVTKAEAQPRISPGQGKRQTHARNQRKRDANRLDRLVTKGILPAGTELADFRKLDVNETTPAEIALAALEEVKVAKILKQASDQTRPVLSQDHELERRRQELLSSLPAGGTEINTDIARNPNLSPPAESSHDVEMRGFEKSTGDISQSQQVTEIRPRVDLLDDDDLRSELYDHAELPPVVESQVDYTSQEIADFAVMSSDTTAHSSGPAKNGGTDVEMKNASITPETAAVDTNSTSSKEPPTSSESNRPGSSRRARLDLGAGKRLLFVALGIKAPKTKKDEERVRNDLMKGVRPLRPSNPAEEPLSDAATETTDEEPDAWRLKINYRAVECVQDEVTLSEPPFPFKQRWDHQQQVSYKGDRGGKRKHDQRDHSQYYHDNPRASKKQKRRKGKHNYAEEQEYLDATYEPSYQDGTQISQFDDSTQNERLESDDVEVEVNQQLLNETAEASQGPEDLMSLPDDPSTLPDLKDGQAAVRMIIAFKQWIMSESTKWQPQISAYRTAIVISITEGGELTLNIAMRDREHTNKRYDPQTGERIYSKFEVPDHDEMDEDVNEGELILLFSDLIEPKIVEEPPAESDDSAIEEDSQSQDITSGDAIALSHKEEPTAEAEAQFSHVTETPLNSDAAEPYQLAESRSDAPAKTEFTETFQERTTPSAEGQLQDNMLVAQAGTIADDFPSADYPVLRSTTPPPEDQVEVNIVEAPSEAPDEIIPLSDNLVLGPNTPSAVLQANSTIAIEMVAEHVSEEARQKWTHLIREEGGFHSSVPSSLTKLIRPVGITSPDGLEKLAKDMEMSEASISRPFSPKFNGLGSSPTRKPRSSSASPQEHTRGESPQLPPQSSWETVDNDMVEDESVTSPPGVVEQLQDALASPAASATSETSRPEVDMKESVAPVSKAMQEWLARKQGRKTSVIISEAESSGTSPVLGSDFGLDGIDERELMASVKYPELSIGSSFTSQVTDHGHQPDFNLEDSLDLTADSPKGPGSEFGESSNDYQLHAVSEAACLGSLNEANEPKAVQEVMPDSENDAPDQPVRQKVTKISVPRQMSPEILKDNPSSEELNLPTIEEMASSRRSLKRENSTPTQASKKDARQSTAIDPFEQDSEDGQITPKASQQRSLSGNLKIRTEKPASQPQASMPRPSQSQPQASQIVDLTMSSDVEAESDSEPEPQKVFRHSSMRYDHDDDFYEDEVETKWVPKKAGNTHGESRRHTSVGLRPSSQTSLNTQNRRKTSAR